MSVIVGIFDPSQSPLAVSVFEGYFDALGGDIRDRLAA